jgi:UDP-3-O-[3-hydroxymyristoyl] glucosamine N-acyltransferase
VGRGFTERREEGPGKREEMVMTFAELALVVGAEISAGLVGDALVRVASVEEAAGDAVVFAVDGKALAAALASRAGAILVSAKLLVEETPADARVLAVRDARYAFALAGRALKAGVGVGGVHATAVIGKGVELGAGTVVGPHTVIEDGVRVGAGCSIGANVTIYAGTTMGGGCVVQAGAVLGSTGFGYARGEDGAYVLFPQQGRLVIEDDVEIGASTTIDRGALGETRIGRGTKIDNLVHVGHNCVIGRNVILAAQTGISGSSVVEDGAILGGQVGIGEHATVGKGVILGGGAGVLSGKKMQGAGQVFWGRPARPLKEYLRDLARLRSGKAKTSE